MGARKAEEQDVRSISRSGAGSYSITLPIAALRSLGWQRGQRVTVKKQGNKLVVEDYKA